MIKKILLLILIGVPISLFGQKGQLTGFENDVELGNVYKSNTLLRGCRYTFDDRIHRCNMDSSAGFINIQFRGITKNGKFLNNKGYMGCFNLSKKQMEWSKKINYQTMSILQSKTWLILSNVDKSSSIDPLTGAENWSLRKNIYFVDDIQRLALGYSSIYGITTPSQTLKAFDRQNGQEVWQRKINREFAWNEAFHLNDSILMVVSSGLHAINLHTGKGWDYEAVTGSKDYTKMAIMNGVGIGLGLLTGVFVTSSGYDVVKDLVSNVISDSTCFFIASKEELACLDHSGNKMWTTPLPKGLTSKSVLLEQDSSIILINKGTAHLGYRAVQVGKPFIASYSQKKGVENFLSIIDLPKIQITDFYCVPDTVYVLTKQQVMKCSLKQGSIEYTNGNIVSENEELVSFLSRRKIYLPLNDSTYQSFAQSDSTLLPIYTTAGKVLLMTHQMKVVKEFNYADLYIAYLKQNGLIFLANRQQTIVINKDGHPVAELKASKEAWMKKDVLYDTDNNSLIAIDLKPLWSVTTTSSY
jgi:outer membrane protein assembly factor BamB